MRAKPVDLPPPDIKKMPKKSLPKATWKPKRMMHLSSETLYFLARVALSSSLETEARLG